MDDLRSMLMSLFGVDNMFPLDLEPWLVSPEGHPELHVLDISLLTPEQLASIYETVAALFEGKGKELKEQLFIWYAMTPEGMHPIQALAKTYLLHWVQQKKAQYTDVPGTRASIVFFEGVIAAALALEITRYETSLNDTATRLQGFLETRAARDLEDAPGDDDTEDDSFGGIDFDELFS